jgi:hypothetical protein
MFREPLLLACAASRCSIQLSRKAMENPLQTATGGRWPANTSAPSLLS